MCFFRNHTRVKTNHSKLVIVWAFVEYLISQHTLPDGQLAEPVLHHVFGTFGKLSGQIFDSICCRQNTLACRSWNFVESWSFGVRLASFGVAWLFWI